MTHVFVGYFLTEHNVVIECIRADHTLFRIQHTTPVFLRHQRISEYYLELLLMTIKARQVKETRSFVPMQQFRSSGAASLRSVLLTSSLPMGLTNETI